MSAASSSSAPSSISLADADPVTRNALRYTISTREYELLHQYLISRSPALKKRSPDPEKIQSAAPDPHDYNAATVRLSLRLFASSYAGLNLYEWVLQKPMGRVAEVYAVNLYEVFTQINNTRPKRKPAFWRSPNFRLSLSLSSILLFHRLLFRFFTRLRTSLQSDDAQPFRRRNPRVWRALTSKLAPAVGASSAGLFLGVSPADQTRITVAIYVFSRSLEFFYENLTNRGYFKNKPWWVGSWMIMPAACGQLLHAFVFDRDCFPASYGNFILKRSPEYIQQRPENYPANLPWPSTFDIVDNLGQIAKLKWPAFVSPILFPKSRTLPVALSKIAPVTDPAHPAIKRLSCALLHPHDPSCLRTWISYYIRAFPTMAKFWTIIYGVFALASYRRLLEAPLTFLNGFAARVLRTTFYLTSAIGTAWSSICLLQHILPGHVLPTSRWFLSGFLAGMWGFVERGSGRSGFLYSARMSIDSLWKVGQKKGWWRGVRNGDVLLFTACIALTNVLYERDPKSVNSGVVRKALGVFRGEGWIDGAVEQKKLEDEKMQEVESKKEQ